MLAVRYTYIGKQIVGYVVKSTGSWKMIGTRSPQDPQVSLVDMTCLARTCWSYRPTALLGMLMHWYTFNASRVKVSNCFAGVLSCCR